MRMLLKSWENMPEFMKNDYVYKYYKVLTKKRVQLLIKRIFDIVLSLLCIIFLSPVLVALAIWIKVDSPGPVFFRQERITQYGKKFRIFKFRTMIVNAEQKGALVTTKSDSRITKVGKMIRHSRLDELPQLFNVLSGDMSFVGTRPEVEKYVNFYSEEMLATLLLPAGITSLASISYRDEDEVISKHISTENSIDDIYIKIILPDKMQYNLKYLENFSVGRDFWLCIKTVI